MMKHFFTLLVIALSWVSNAAQAQEAESTPLPEVRIHSIGISGSVATLRAEILLCREVFAEDFEVHVRQEAGAQWIQIVDRNGVDCRSAPTLQEVVLETTEFQRGKPFYLANPMAVTYRMVIPRGIED